MSDNPLPKPKVAKVKSPILAQTDGTPGGPSTPGAKAARAAAAARQSTDAANQ